MIFAKLPPVLDSRQVLLDHVQAKLSQLVPTQSIIQHLAEELCENRSYLEITRLLGDETLLHKAILGLVLKIDGNTKQVLGAELFSYVSNFETSLCAQITGMLLDLDVLTICKLLSDQDALEKAVLKAKEEYLNYKQKSSKEFFGEEIFSHVLVRFPDADLAARLTGMLLELDVSELRQLLENPHLLNTRLEAARAAIDS